jgi:hypothetical protein
MHLVTFDSYDTTNYFLLLISITLICFMSLLGFSVNNKNLFEVQVGPAASDGTPLAQIGREFKVDLLIRRERYSGWMPATLGAVNLELRSVRS